MYKDKILKNKSVSKNAHSQQINTDKKYDKENIAHHWFRWYSPTDFKVKNISTIWFKRNCFVIYTVCPTKFDTNITTIKLSIKFIHE